MDKRILKQYIDLKNESREIRKRIEELEAEIGQWDLSDDIGLQLRYAAKDLLASYLRSCEIGICAKTVEVEEYLESIDDSFMRRLIRFRVVDGLKWEEVAIKMGGGNSEDSVRKAFNRFINPS